MELRLLLDILWRRRWVILEVFAVVVVLMIGSTFMLPPIYESAAKVSLRSADAESLLLSNLGVKGLTPTRSDDSDISTSVLLATSRPILEDVIGKLQLRNTSGHLLKPERFVDPSIIVGKLFPKPFVQMRQLEDSNVIKINATSRDPDESAMIANTLAKLYIKDNLAKRQEQYKSAREFIEQQLTAVRREYLEVLSELQAFKTSEQIVDLEGETTAAIQRMDSLLREKQEKLSLLADVTARMQELEAQLASDSVRGLAGVAMQENSHVQTLRRMLSELEQELAQETVEKTEEHPDVVVVRSRIAQTKKELAAELETFRGGSGKLLEFQREQAALKAQIQSISTEMERHRGVMFELPAKSSNSAQLELKYRVNQEMYSSLLEYLYQIGLAESMTLSNIRLEEKAVVPDVDKPKSPSLLINTILGIVLGIGLGLAFGLVMEYMDNSVRTPDDVKELGLPFLGSVPKFKRTRRMSIDKKDPRSPLYEAYRSLRNAIRYAGVDEEIKAVEVTSALASEGKTTTAVNLAIILAHEGKRVLLVDTDLRKPNTHKYFGLPNDIGLTSLMAEKAELAVAVQTTRVKDLYLLSSGPVPPDPARIPPPRL